ncbi:GGDEF and EAL domain-containing protein [Rhodanobacter sp. DHG33]|uniref:putative bifunctional diguanylate cyclase/phosphodiesterase n=1 Tax=Rhodanobacter sp. DHG33 TaxID=2775921 RepID=UPI001786F091|nr:GGDEF and EAL domain-containing protein [Rhodanobacter sp. DHG33]MBD8898835.1 EAL domain-containing protein [Rhodanobacter sp. DHG33]
MPLASTSPSLIHRLSLTLWGLFLALLLVLSVLCYAALRVTADRVAPLVIQQWVQLKAQTNEGLLVQADASVRRLRQTLVQRLDKAPPDTAERFDKLFARSPDGLWRVRPELVDTYATPLLYLHEGPHGLSDSVRLRAVVSYDLLREQGPALVPPFFSTYLDFAENGLMEYAHGVDWGGNAGMQAGNANYPPMQGADPRRNPARKVFWTPVYLDEQAHTWMVSVVAPLDWQGHWVGALGHDVAIQALIDSVNDIRHHAAVQQLIMDSEGNLIAHSKLRDRIAAAHGQLQITTLGNHALDQVFRTVLAAHSDMGTGRTADGSQWVAWSRIRGPGWFQVNVLPQKRVDQWVMLGWLMMCAVCLLILGPSLWLLRRRVHALVTSPLLHLTRAVDELGQGRTPQPIALDSPDELGRLANAFDAMVAELVQQRERLTTLAECDTLTGLHNRHYFEAELARFFRGGVRTARQGAVLLFDLDEFKYVNDTFGHIAGDTLLLRVAAEVKALVHESDTLCRLGGDEFAVFMPHATLNSALVLAERIVGNLGRLALEIEGRPLRLTTSLGVAHFPDHGQNAEELVSHADMAMYQAKRLGKNRWNIYRSDRDAMQAVAARLAWNERIEHALERGLLRLHFQGVYGTVSGELTHLEALVRMVDEADPTHYIAPDQFIGYAEKSGKIVDIDRWMVRESIALLAEHPRLPALAINISGRSFDDPDLPGFITTELATHGVAPKRLLVELTETAAISDLRDAERFIDALRHAGCSLCLDDFGSGFASFAYLKRLKVDVLKIDGLFIRNLPHERDNQVFVRSIIEVARGMGQRTVAEFVEDEETLRLLREFGVDMVQGYYLDKPQADHPALRE